MKKLILLTAIVFFTFDAIAQTKNIDIDKLKFKAVYKISPSKPLDPLFFYYNTKLESSGVVRNNVSLNDIENMLIIQGQKKTTEKEKATLTLEVSLGDFMITGTDIKENKRESKDSKGNVHISYNYDLIVNYDMPRHYKVINKDNIVIDELKKVSRAGKFTDEKFTRNFGSYGEAKNFWDNNRQSLSSQFMSQLAKDIASNASYYPSLYYGFFVTGVNDALMTMDEKKHAENEMFRKMTDSLKKEIEAMTPEIGIDKVKIKDIAEYYKEIPTRYTDPKRKADKKIRYAAYYNLCKLYLYSDEPQKIDEYADLLIANDYDEEDGEKLKEAAALAKKRLERTFIHTSHFKEDDYNDTLK